MSTCRGNIFRGTNALDYIKRRRERITNGFSVINKQDLIHLLGGVRSTQVAVLLVVPTSAASSNTARSNRAQCRLSDRKLHHSLVTLQALQQTAVHLEISLWQLPTGLY